MRHHLDEQIETGFGSARSRFFNHQESVRTMQFKDCRERLSRQSCLCAIFATRNSLKSKAAQNIKSPFSNIRAIISKLHWRSRPT
jgi:hypothetical protein